MMKLSSKLDALQELAQKHEDEPHKLYAIKLLAEHADDPEMTAGFMAWLKNVFLFCC
ncbi:MAG: hypothetical protein FWD06_10295 [Oscillospiraceae bacterium]|nr:hypothetical protein [Oscillospiraceae bacterium]